MKKKSNPSQPDKLQLCMCIDYRKVNQSLITACNNSNGKIVSTFPLPKIQELLSCLNKCKYFSSLDLHSGYYHISLTEYAKKKTAFMIADGKYQWNVVPLGLATAVSTFQYLMSTVLTVSQLLVKLRINQNGFRPGCSTVSQILALRRIMEGVKSNNLLAIITFIDFTKAFNTIHRGKMIRILRVYGIPNELVEAIDDMYQDSTAKDLSPDGETKPFKILSGVLQGDTLAPYLFIIVLDYALRKAIDGREEELGFCLKKCQSRRVGPEVLTDLDFANDIALMSEQIHQAQNLLNNVEVQCGKIGLKINAMKTKSIVFNHQLPVTLHTLDGSELEIVQDFKYLGSLIQSTKADIMSRRAAAWKACNKLKNIWKAPLGRSFKLRLSWQ